MPKNPLNVVLLSYHNQNGGAGIACGRLAEALRKEGHRVTYLVQEKSGTDSSILVNPSRFAKSIAWIRFILERLYFLMYEKDKSIRFLFNPGVFGQDLSKHPEIIQADIIHIHWVNFGFLGIQNIGQLAKLGKPVIWTLHDMWAFTGGCHHSGDCHGFQSTCGHCKFLKNPASNDLSHTLWAQKIHYWKQNNLKIITCSDWLKTKATSSSILKTHEIIHIPNAIDIDLFSPRDKSEARIRLGLNPEKNYLLFVAMRVNAPAKGFMYLKEALEIWIQNNPEKTQDTNLLLVGEVINPTLFESLAIPMVSLGKIKGTENMVDVYSAADIFVTPSMEENLPNTIMEAMACGTPCVGFAVGGIPEMIEHRQNGYVVNAFEPIDLAQGITWTFENKKVAGELSRKKVGESYSEQIIAQQHVDFYLKSLQDVG